MSARSTVVGPTDIGRGIGRAVGPTSVIVIIIIWLNQWQEVGLSLVLRR